MEKQKTPNLVILGVLTLITIVLWIGLGAFRAFTSEAPSKVPAEILEPLSPNLDTETLGEISSRLFFEEYELPETVITVPSPSPSPEVEELIEEEETATGSATGETATESATNEATESGGLE